MTTRVKHDQRTKHRTDRRPAFDWLEPKLVLNASTLSVAATTIQPFDNSSPSAPPLGPTLTVVGVDSKLGTNIQASQANFTIRFDRPVDPNSFFNDFTIYQVGPQEELTSVDSLGFKIVETVSDDGQSIAVSTDRLLSAGNYRLVLSGTAYLSGLDGSTVAPNDQTLGEWTIDAAGLGLEDAVGIPSPTGTPQTITSSLDTTNNTQDVKLYRFHLGDEHQTWRLTLQIDSGRIKSPLMTNLSLFDAKGNLIDTTETGRPAYPNDPFLFHGLKPGDYYIGVSGAGNNPGTPKGYDLISHKSGNANPSVASGNFNLSFAADPADTSTEVKTFFLNRADSNDPNPTGFTLQFNGPIDEKSLKAGNKDAVSIVDHYGHRWTSHAVGYNEATSTVVFGFDKPIPQGSYSIVLGSRGLVDLAGKSPVSPGFESGTLAKFQIGIVKPKTDPFDLGTVLADDALQGIKRTVHLTPGQTVIYRLVITIPGTYDLATTYSGGAPKMFATIGGQRLTVDAAAKPGEQLSNFAEIPTGILSFIATGGKNGTDLQITFKLPGSLLDQLLDSGVGQGSALESRLIVPSSISAGAFSSDTGGYGPGSTTGFGNTSGLGISGSGGSTLQTTGSTSTSSSSTSASTSPGLSGLLVAAPSLVGHPLILNEQVAPVGPVSTSGNTSLAYNGTGLPMGLDGRGQLGRVSKPLTSGEMVSRSVPEVDDVAEATGMITASPRNITASNKPDEKAIGSVEATNIFDIGLAMVSRMFTRQQVESRLDITEENGEVVASDTSLIAMLDPTTTSSDQPTDGEPIEGKDLGSSIGVGVVAVGAVAFQTKLRRWVERRRSTFTIKREVDRSAGGVRHAV